MNRNYSNNKDDDENVDVEGHPYTKSIIPVNKFEDYTRNKMEDHTDLFLRKHGKVQGKEVGY